jgi:hypothetical protein
MTDSEERARVRGATELREYRLMDLPGYMEWGEKHLDRWPALVAHLDATSIMLHPSELPGPHDALFDEMLAELKEDLGVTDED